MGKKKSASSDGPNPSDPWEFDAGAVSVADADDSRGAIDPEPVNETDWLDENITSPAPVVVTAKTEVTAIATPATAQDTPFLGFDADAMKRAEAIVARNNSRAFLYFDLETVPDYSRSQLFDLEPVPEVPPFVERQHCGDPVAILSKKIDDIEMDLRLASGLQPVQLDERFLDDCERIEKGQPKPRKGVLDLIAAARTVSAGALKANEERRKLLSTTPEYCMIAAMACASGSGEVAVWINSSIVSPEGNDIQASVATVKFADEAELLDAWWSLAQQHKALVGFNIVHFDLPVIFTRSILLGVKPRRMIDTTPWKGDVIDLYAKRFPKGNSDKQRPGKLKSLAKVLGIDVPAGDCDGSQVEQLAKESPGKLAEYVASDIVVTRALHQMYRGYFC